PAERQIREQVLWPGFLFLGRDGRDVASDESVDLGVSHVVIRQYPEQRLYRIDRARFSDDPAQSARVPGLDDASDLLGLDVEKFVADFTPRARFHQPAGHLARRHGEPPLRHDNRSDAALRHVTSAPHEALRRSPASPLATVLRTAAAIAPQLGT